MNLSSKVMILMIFEKHVFFGTKKPIFGAKLGAEKPTSGIGHKKAIFAPSPIEKSCFYKTNEN